MRIILLSILTSSFLPGCLPDPTDILFGDSPESSTSVKEVSGTEEEYTSDGGDYSEENEMHYGSSSFGYDASLLLTDDTSTISTEDPDAEGIDDEVSIQYFGTSDLSLICAKDAPKLNPVGFIRVSIESTLPTEKLPIESWQRRIEVPCSGNIDFKYFKISRNHTYNVKVEQLKADGSVAKTSAGSFTVPADMIETVKFELK